MYSSDSSSDIYLVTLGLVQVVRKCLKYNGFELSVDSSHKTEYIVEARHFYFSSLMGMLGSLHTWRFPVSVLPFYSAPACVGGNGVSHQSPEHEGLWKRKWRYQITIPHKSRLQPLSSQTQEGAVFLKKHPDWIRPGLGGMPELVGALWVTFTFLHRRPFVHRPVTASNRISGFQPWGVWCISGVPNKRMSPCSTAERH